MLEYVHIYGERCSGTKYLEKLIELNFNVKFTNLYGFKYDCSILITDEGNPEGYGTYPVNGTSFFIKD